MSKLFLAEVFNGSIKLKSANIKKDTGHSYVLKSKLAGVTEIPKEIVADTNGDFYSLGLSEREAFTKLLAKQQAKKAEVQDAIDKISSHL
jgi:hypothetical protein